MATDDQIAEMRKMLGPGGAPSIIPDAALQVIYDSSQSEINHVSGGANSVGAQFDAVRMKVDAKVTNGLFQIEYGDRNGMSMMRYQDKVGPNVAVLDIHGTASFLSNLGTSYCSTYLIRNGELYEFTFDNFVIVSATQGQYAYLATNPLGQSRQVALSTLPSLMPTTVRAMVAAPGAYIAIEAQDLDAIKKQALLELVKLKVSYDATTSMRDGSYSKVSSDYAKERVRILKTISDRLV